MTPNSAPTTHNILILKADRLCAGTLEQLAQRMFPTANIRVANSLKAGRLELNAQPVHLLLTGVSLPDGDSLDLLGEGADEPRRYRRALVITSRWEQRILATLRGLPIHGVFDPTSEGPAELKRAIQKVAEGGVYWSTSVLNRSKPEAVPRGLIGQKLSPTEHLVFAVIGDGCDDSKAAEQLQLRPSTVHSVRRDLHRKLGVQHKGELIRLAVLHGYVRFTEEGVQRPGFSGLLAACKKRKPIQTLAT